MTPDEARDSLIRVFKATRRPRLLRATWQVVCWFLLPFGVLWGMGVPPEVAARVAVAPSACMAVCSILAMVAGAFVVRVFAAPAKEGT